MGAVEQRRNKMADTTSSTSPTLPSGVLAISFCFKAKPDPIDIHSRARAVITMFGFTELTRMLWGPSSNACKVKRGLNGRNRSPYKITKLVGHLIL